MLPKTQKTKQGMSPWVWIVAAIAYFLWPADLVIDVIPYLGMADDVGFAFVCIKQFHAARCAEKARTAETTVEHGRNES